MRPTNVWQRYTFRPQAYSTSRVMTYWSLTDTTRERFSQNASSGKATVARRSPGACIACHRRQTSVRRDIKCNNAGNDWCNHRTLTGAGTACHHRQTSLAPPCWQLPAPSQDDSVKPNGAGKACHRCWASTETTPRTSTLATISATIEPRYAQQFW